MENIRFECPHCHRVLESAPSFAGMNCRCPSCQGEVVVPPAPPGGAGADRDRMVRIYRLYMGFGIATLILSSLAMVPLLLMHFSVEQLRNSPPDDPNKLWATLAPVLAVMGCIIVGVALTAIPTLVFKCILLYRMWRMVPPERAATTPGKAVGFLFIPIFNLYWNFVAFFELGKVLEERGGTPSPRQLSLAFAIVSIAAVAGGCCASIFQIAAGVLELVMMASFFAAVRRWHGWK